jgi:hypothetical protein
MEEYLIEADASGGYRVRTCRPNVEHNPIVAEFATYEQAQAWVAEQTRLGLRSANASDVA